ncbi:hypothetical protein ACF07S_12440 [Streptomyces sp. NPDC016640]|uniref:hypothetical protein n=1 Tax=Streptomyces sp. NPDC016640 TaxID=3364969 RepID=UPI0036F9E180
MSLPPLASGPHGPSHPRPLPGTVLDAPHTGTRARGGPLPVGGPDTVTARPRNAAGDVLPERSGSEALRRHLLTTGRAVPGRARADGRLRPKATFPHPATGPGDPAGLLTLVHQAHAEGPR